MIASLSDLIDPLTGERFYLNKEERTAFKKSAQLLKPDARTFCMMLYYTGCRPSEALEVTPNRLDYAEEWVRFRTLKQKRHNPNKPDKYRTVELPFEYLSDLESFYKAKANKGNDKFGSIPIWSFTYRTGYRYVKQAMADAEITGVKACPKGLRHSMGVSLALDRVPINVIANILGHADANNTLIYLQIIDKERRGMISKTW